MLSVVTELLSDLELQRSCAGAGIALLLGLIVYVARVRSSTDAIPAIGRTGFFTSYFSAIRYMKHAQAMLQEGYKKYESKIFRVPELSRWSIIISNGKLIEELWKTPEEILSSREAFRELFAADYTIGKNIYLDQYHVGIVRAQLTRNIGKNFPNLRDEMIEAFNDNIPADDWTSVKVLDTAMRLVSRTSNRIFVGAPTCRNPEYTALCIQFTVDVVVGAQIIRLFPKFLKPLAARMLTNVPKAIETALKHLKPIIEERRRKIDEYGQNYPDKPNDMLSWLMDEATGEGCSMENLTRRILFLNFASIHSSSMSLAHALYNLATYPEHIEPLRAEIESVVAKEGWSKASMGRMHKLDSFLKECQRLTPTDDLPIGRKAIKPYTFSDGTFIPKGSMISVMVARHRDKQVYSHPDEFDGFRFSNIREKEGDGIKTQFVATSTDFMPFGHGRTACPGRFFAANTLKAMMAHLLTTYDFKLAQPGMRPADEFFGSARIPNRKAEMFFRKRVV